MRVLHLIDQPGMALGADRRADPDAALLACAALRQQLPEFAQSVCLIGGNDLEERAAGAGLPTTDRVAPPLGEAVRARAGFKGLLRNRGRPDLIHCWSRATAMLAEGFGLPVCQTDLGKLEPSGSGPSDQVPVIRKPGMDGEAPVVRFAALPAAKLEILPEDRRRLRRELGADDREPVLILMGGRPGEADALRMEFFSGILHFSGRPVVWLIPASSARLARALRFHARARWASRLIVSDRPFSDQVGAADLGVWLGAAWADAGGIGPSAAAGTLISAALSAGLPVVAPGSPLIAPLYRGGSGGECLAFNGTLAEVARKLLPLADDPQRREALRDAVAGERPVQPGPAFERVVAEQWLACGGKATTAYAERA